jgi:glutaredoxin
MKKVSFIYLPILFFIYIAIETFLKLNHSSLCESSGCQLAGNLLWFESIYLNYMGLLSALTLLVLGYMGYYKKISERFFFLVLFASLLFETVLLGYQYFVSPEMCKFCMGIYGFLVTMMLLASRRYFLMVLPTVGAVIMALSFLNMPTSEAFVTQDGNYLIQSPSCNHCKKVKSYLTEEKIAFKKLDIDEVEAQNFATFLNFNTIPILLIKEGKNVQIINGDSNIIEFFKEKKRNPEEIVIEESITIDTGSSSSLFDGVSDEGCGFATLNKVESDCSK